MNILYLGAFPPDFLVKRSGGKIDSLYRAADPLIHGMRNNSDVNIEVLTSPDIASWPKGPLFVAHENSETDRLTMVSSLNISLVKQLWTIVSMVREAGRYIRKNKEQTIVIIPYVVFRHVFTLRLLHWLYPKKVIQACIVPDIFFPKKKIKRWINTWTEHMASKFDAFVLYTKKMAKHLNVSEGHYEVIEGFREVPERKPVISEGFNVVYAGSLNINYGVGRLIEAMSIVDDSEISLHLYGAGSAENMIIETSKKDPRIVYHGKVPNAVATDAIYSASVLINPRNADDGEYTEYSFPSKDIEYMATGIPTLLCKLPGMPKEYYGHFIDMGEATPEQIASAIIKTKQLSNSERYVIGKDARDFIIQRMDYNKQVLRIVSLFKRVMSA